MDACEQFLTAEHPSLLRAAFLLTCDRTAAQDLAQETAVRIVMQWRKVERADNPQAYARTILMNIFLGGKRRAWNAEVPHDAPPDVPTGRSPYEDVDTKDVLRHHLLALPPRQRAAVVLRFYEDLSEAKAAEVLGCSVGNVKALTSRGLAQLRLSVTPDAGHIDRKAWR